MDEKKLGGLVFGAYKFLLGLEYPRGEVTTSLTDYFIKEYNLCKENAGRLALHFFLVATERRPFFIVNNGNGLKLNEKAKQNLGKLVGDTFNDLRDGIKDEDPCAYPDLRTILESA